MKAPMEADPVERTTRLLKRMSAGDAAAGGELMGIVYDELRDRARALTRGQPNLTLQPTAIVHEAWMKLSGPGQHEWEGRSHFIRTASKAMRSILIDYARARKAQKRGDGQARVEFDGGAVLDRNVDLFLELDEALQRLAQLDERLAQIAEWRCFIGYTHEEVAELLGVSVRSAERSWRAARAWLQRELDSEGLIE